MQTITRLSSVLSLAFVATFAAIAKTQESAGTNVVPIQVNGDPATRFTLVVLGDGYTAAEMPKFSAHVDKHLNILWSIEPFRSYRSYINVYAVEILSTESGIACDPEVREQRKTPLGTQFGGGCTNPNARGINVNQQAAREYAARATPDFDQILVIANTDTYGGIGGSVATTSGGNSLGPLITPHELGHSLGRLQDEYTYSARGKAGGPYTGQEPNSIHHTLLTEEQMKTDQRKWFRWLGEESLSGGKIGRFEGGQSRTTGIWRPSQHSMMISVGYSFDQVSRERMTERISSQVELIARSRPTDTPVHNTEAIWIETAHPVYHQLDVKWSIDGNEMTGANNSLYLNIGAMDLPAGAKNVSVTVVDPTPFVRDPAIREKALTATRAWTLGPNMPAPGPAEVAFTASTPTDKPVGGRDVVYVVTTHPPETLLYVEWRLNGRVVPMSNSTRSFPLAEQKMAPGTHKLTATVTDPRGRRDVSQTREWTIDNTEPTVEYTLSAPFASASAPDGARHYFMRDEFTMRLNPRDDQPGYVVAEFRVNGDGWHHYYGWPDAPPGTPFRFTPRGTTIKELVYGSLSSEGLSPQPWEPREPGWGTHRIEYRAIDAAGNISAPKAFRVTLMPSPSTCTNRVTGRHEGELRVDSGVTCLEGATVGGPITIESGASLFAIESKITGAVTSQGAATVELIDTTIEGALRVSGSTGTVTVFGTTITGDLTLADNQGKASVLVTGSTAGGRVSCSGNAVSPVNGGTPNTFSRGATGQCSGM
jgi:IgA Peptidase M64